MKSILWTLCAVGLGIGLGTVEVGGRTPWQHGVRSWHRFVNPRELATLKDKASDVWDDAKANLHGAKTPHEHHSVDDRDALNRLIAHRATTAR